MLIVSALGTIVLLVVFFLGQTTASISTAERIVTHDYRINEIDKNGRSNADEEIHILVRLPKLDGAYEHAMERHQETFEWLLALSSASLHLHIVVPQDSFELVDKILNRANDSVQVGSEVTKYDLETFTDQLMGIANIEFAQDREFSKMLATRMPTFILPYYFLQLKHIIVLDSSVIIHADIAQLYKHFQHFTAEQMIGVVQQQKPKYRNSFSMYQKYYPASGLGGPSRPGFNSALLLLDLQQMRHSMKFNAYIHYITMRHLVHKYYFSKHSNVLITQDDVLTLMGFEHPELFYILPCGWNRQLDSIDFSQSESIDYNQCDGKIYADFIEEK